MTTPDPSPVPESTPKPTGSAGPSCAVAAGSASALWNHMAETHNLHLLASEESDIRHAANAGAEAEIRDLKNRMRPWMLGESYDLRAENDRLRESLHAIAAADWKTSGELRRMARVALEPNVADEPRGRGAR